MQNVQSITHQFAHLKCNTYSFFELKSVKSNLHKTSSSIGFAKMALHNDIMPTFAKVKGQFIDQSDRLSEQQKISRNHLINHGNKIMLLVIFTFFCFGSKITFLGKLNSKLNSAN